MIREEVVKICTNWHNMPELAEPIIKAGYNARKNLPRGFTIPLSGANSDWCACMVSECLSEAFDKYGIENPYREVSADKLHKLFAKDFGTDSTGNYCRVGDIVFYDWNNNGVSDHVGIITSLVEKEGCVIGAKVCEGNINDRMYIRTIRFGEKVNGCYPKFIYVVYPDEESDSGEGDTTEEVKETLKQILNYCKAIEKLIENL